MQALDDITLLQDYAKRNSEAAFETLVSRYAPLVYSAAMRQTRDPHSAEEVTQAVFVILAKKAGQIGGNILLSGWLFKTTRFVALAQTRTAARRSKYHQEFRMRSEDPLNPPDALWEQIAPLLDEALTKLGEKDRRAVLLRYFENKSLAEVGGVFGVGEDAARMRINRALEKLHLFLVKRGVPSTSAMIAGSISANSVQAAPAASLKTITSIALAKGSTASAATLTLINGAWKIVVLAKVKNAGIAGGLMLLTTGLCLLMFNGIHAWRVAHFPDIQGAWEGSMLLDDAGVGTGEAARTRVVLKLIKTKKGYVATTDWIEMGRAAVPMGLVQYDYPLLEIQRNPRETWKLRVNADATQMILDHAIHFIQPDPVLFLRTATPDSVPARLMESEFAFRAGSQMQGYWIGEFDDGANAIPATLKVAEHGDGTFRGEISWPGTGVEGLPLTGSYQQTQVKFADAIGHGLFQGTLNAEHTEIIGSWTQGGKSSPAKLKRADYGVEHAMEAEKSYAFDSENDLQGHWKGTWILPFGKVRVAIRLALDIAKLPDGTYSASLASIDQFGNDGPIPASEFQHDLPKVHLEWKWAGGVYEGKLERGKLVGVWFQGGGGFPLTFERVHPG